MSVVRAVAIAVILLDLALLAVAGPMKATARRYAAAARQKELRVLSLENRELLHKVALARRPEEVARKAATFGIQLDTIERERIDRSADPSSAGREATVKAPRR
jgi:hypothetical protein